MKWNGQEVAKLPNDKLQEAYAKLNSMEQERNARIAQAKERHEPFKLNEAEPNPIFTELFTEITVEMQNRKMLWV